MQKKKNKTKYLLYGTFAYIFICMSRRISYSFKVGDIVIERNTGKARKRVGEIVFISDGRRPKLKLLELSPRSLIPKFNNNHSKLLHFSLAVENCRKLRVINIKRNVFRLGDVIRHRCYGRVRFGIIVGFHHPDGLYSESWENGYNGKDTIECVEVSGRSGLPRKRDPHGSIKKFAIEPSRARLCEILPMDQNGGVRIKDSLEQR